MNNTVRIGIVVVLLGAVGIVLAMKADRSDSRPALSGDPAAPAAIEAQAAPAAGTKLPRLVDLGADKCVPCKMMEPVLDELRTEYEGQLRVEFYDVWKQPEHAEAYGVRVIPTQIFFSADGEELWRHEGFLSKEAILAKWEELGVDLIGIQAPPHLVSP